MSHFNDVINLVGDIDELTPFMRRVNYEFVDSDQEPPCDILKTFENTLDLPIKIFGQPLPYKPGYTPILLFKPQGDCSGRNDDCNYEDICSNQQMLFGSWKTLWNCLTLSGMAVASRNFPWYFNASSPAIANGSISDYDTQWISEALQPLGFDLDTIHKFDTTKVFNLTFECAQASCQQWTGQGLCLLDYPEIDGNGSNPEGSNITAVDLAMLRGGWDELGVSSYLNYVCDDLQTLNVDIAGPGVLMSYMIQCVLVIAIWSFLRVTLAEHTIDFFMTPFLWITRGREGARESFTGLYPSFQSLLRRLERSNSMQSTITVLVDLQEAQCFFLIAVQIAILVATKQGPGFHAGSTLFGLEENRQAAIELASLGMALVCIIQLTLCRLRVDAIYTLLLSTCVIGLATTTMRIGFSRVQMASTLESLRESMTVDQCGGQGSLRFQCPGGTSFSGIGLNEIGYYRADEARLGTIYLSFVVVWVIKACREVADRRIGKKVKMYYWGSVWRRCFHVHIWLDAWVAIMLFALEFWLGFTVVENFNSLGTNLVVEENFAYYYTNSKTSSPSPSQSWNIGQVLAVLVWLPVGLRYIYVLIRGIEKGFRMRFSGLYEVRRKPEKMQGNNLELPSSTPAPSFTSTDSLQQNDEQREIQRFQCSSSDTLGSAFDATRADRLERGDATA